MLYTFEPSADTDGRASNEDTVTFIGDSNLYAADARTSAVAFDDHATGWYAQAVYKFDPQWCIGARYSQLASADTPAGLVGSALDADGYDPKAYSTMLDWTNSEFLRVRFQYNQEELSYGEDDNQFLLQYIMSLGAQGIGFYLLFAMAITSSVQLVGVYVVFASLILPDPACTCRHMVITQTPYSMGLRHCLRNGWHLRSDLLR